MVSSQTYPILSAHNLTKTFNDETVLNHISLEAYKGELISIIGPSGCGKSTLLRCLNCLEIPDEGTITAKDVHITCHKNQWGAQQEKQAHLLRTHVGMVFQDFNLFPHLTVLDNILLAPQIVQDRKKTFTQEEAYELLKKVGLEKMAKRYPPALSGGQQQRAAIARALAMQPEIILYDEPTSALDPIMSGEVFDVMVELDRSDITQIVVTHNMRFARHASDRIIFMNNGHIQETLSPKELSNKDIFQNTRYFMKDVL